MIYTHDFKYRVASVVADPIDRSKILNDQIDIGRYLIENAFKGISPRVILECLDIGDYSYLKTLALQQEKLINLYKEYFEFYVLKKDPSSKQMEIDKEISLKMNLNNSGK